MSNLFLALKSEYERSMGVMCNAAHHRSEVECYRTSILKQSSLGKAPHLIFCSDFDGTLLQGNCQEYGLLQHLTGMFDELQDPGFISFWSKCNLDFDNIGNYVKIIKDLLVEKGLPTYFLPKKSAFKPGVLTFASELEKHFPLTIEKIILSCGLFNIIEPLRVLLKFDAVYASGIYPNGSELTGYPLRPWDKANILANLMKWSNYNCAIVYIGDSGSDYDAFDFLVSMKDKISSLIVYVGDPALLPLRFGENVVVCRPDYRTESDLFKEVISFYSFQSSLSHNDVPILDA